MEKHSTTARDHWWQPESYADAEATTIVTDFFATGLLILATRDRWNVLGCQFEGEVEEAARVNVQCALVSGLGARRDGWLDAWGSWCDETLTTDHHQGPAVRFLLPPTTAPL